jgi:hypothetical protein
MMAFIGGGSNDSSSGDDKGVHLHIKKDIKRASFNVALVGIAGDAFLVFRVLATSLSLSLSHPNPSPSLPPPPPPPPPPPLPPPLPTPPRSVAPFFHFISR